MVVTQVVRTWALASRSLPMTASSCGESAPDCAACSSAVERWLLPERLERDAFARFGEHLGGEAQLADALQGARQGHHGIRVGRRHRRVAALPLHRQGVALERLLRHADLRRLHAREVRRDHQRAALVQRQLGVDEVAVVLRQPARARQPAGLLARGQRHDEVAAELLRAARRLQRDGRERRRHRLVVAHPARVQVAVLLGGLEGRHGPRLAFDRHHVDVREQEERPLCARPSHAGDQVPASRRGLEELRLDAGALEPCHQRLQRCGLVAVAGVDAQQLVEDLARLGFDGAGRQRGTGEGEEHV